MKQFATIIGALVPMAQSPATCSPYEPPTTAARVVRQPTAVAASFDRTWIAAIDAFADQNIPIQNIDKASGLITTQLMNVGRDDTAWADCGTSYGIKNDPTDGVFNVRVRGDSAQATVQVTARFRYLEPGSSASFPDEMLSCESTGLFERRVEANIKARAEGR